jgi:hypothetical protein
VIAHDLPGSAMPPRRIWMRSPSTSLSHCGFARVFAGLKGRRIWVLARTGTQIEGGGFMSIGRSMGARLVVGPLPRW